ETYVREHAIDLVVMTTHGRGGISRAWLGSVADSFIRQSTAPILLIRPDARERSATAARQAPARHILIPLDGSETAERVIGAAVKLGSPSAARYLLLRVVTPLSVVADYGPPSAVFDDPTLSDRRREAVEYVSRLAERMSDDGFDVAGAVVIAPSAAAAITEYADAHDADLIAIGTRGLGGPRRMLLGSVADKIVRTSRRPVLVCNTALAATGAPGGEELVATATAVEGISVHELRRRRTDAPRRYRRLERKIVGLHGRSRGCAQDQDDATGRSRTGGRHGPGRARRGAEGGPFARGALARREPAREDSGRERGHHHGGDAGRGGGSGPVVRRAGRPGGAAAHRATGAGGHGGERCGERGAGAARAGPAARAGAHGAAGRRGRPRCASAAVSSGGPRPARGGRRAERDAGARGRVPGAAEGDHGARARGGGGGAEAAGAGAVQRHGTVAQRADDPAAAGAHEGERRRARHRAGRSARGPRRGDGAAPALRVRPAPAGARHARPAARPGGVRAIHHRAGGYRGPGACRAGRGPAHARSRAGAVPDHPGGAEQRRAPFGRGRGGGAHRARGRPRRRHYRGCRPRLRPGGSGARRGDRAAGHGRACGVGRRDGPRAQRAGRRHPRGRPDPRA